MIFVLRNTLVYLQYQIYKYNNYRHKALLLLFYWKCWSFIIKKKDNDIGFIHKNVSSSTCHKKTPSFGNLRKFFLTHSFMNWFWYKFIWMLTLWIFVFFSIRGKHFPRAWSFVQGNIFFDTIVYYSIIFTKSTL